MVIDYVTFPEEAIWLKEQLEDMQVLVKYVVLWTDKETLVKRDKTRPPEHQMGERCLILMGEFLESGLEERHFFYNNQPMDCVIERIIAEERFVR